MGAPKIKWTPAEEEALRAGITKYGRGKWSTILRDPEFGSILHSRSNVDLKDKWRNIYVAASGMGCRNKVKVAFRTIKSVKPKGMALSTVDESDSKVAAVMPLGVTGGKSEDSEPDCTKKVMPRLDSLILEAIGKMKGVSSRAAILTYIEEKYIAPPNLDKLLVATLKSLTETSKLIKVRHRYRIAPPTSSFVLKNDIAESGPVEKQKNAPAIASILPDTLNNLTITSIVPQIGPELEEMKSMTAREAKALAARFVAEAEAAVAAAEEAAREADEADKQVEDEMKFVEAAKADVAASALKLRAVCTWLVTPSSFLY